jgi:hypothetical protein
VLSEAGAVYGLASIYDKAEIKKDLPILDTPFSFSDFSSPTVSRPLTFAQHSSSCEIEAHWKL